MKKLILPVLMLFASFGAFAEGTALKVLLTDGSSATFVLSEKPTVSFSGTEMNIVSPDASTSYHRSDVASISFVKEISAIRDVEATDAIYRFIDNVFEAQSCEISVYSLSGVKVAQGFDCLSLESLQSGVYVVTAGNQSIKIRKN